MEQSTSSGTKEQNLVLLESKNAKGQQGKGATCTLTNNHLYIDGAAYFLNHLGIWKKVHDRGTFNIKDITKVEYQRRSNPSKAWFRFLLKLLLSILFGFFAVISLESYYNVVAITFVVVFLIFIAPILAANAIVIIASKRESMLKIMMGSEAIYLKTSWYKKEDIDNLYNQLIRLVDAVHANEQIDLDTSTGELFGGEPIIAEFGEQYRRQYMKDEKTTGGFCMLTPERILSGGLHKVQLIPGVWLPSRTQHSINKVQIENAYFKDHIRFLKIFLIDILITAIPISISVIEYLTRLEFAWFTILLSGAFFIGFPDLAGGKMRRARLIIQGTSGTYGFDTQWYTKEEVNSFQKVITKVIETNIEKNKTAQVKMTAINQSAPIIQHSAPQIHTGEQVSIKDGANLLREYNQLLQEGVIDQAEFDKIKAEILSGRESN